MVCGNSKTREPESRIVASCVTYQLWASVFFHGKSGLLELTSENCGENNWGYSFNVKVAQSLAPYTSTQ